ncbi:MAG: hypothetical protein QOG53_144 [Frankiales bacterium]|jgi:hypothetical protein|nr:hypothetical protein [Frankiales bacterium]
MPDADEIFRRMLVESTGTFAMPTADQLEKRARARRNRRRVATGVAAGVVAIALGTSAALALGGDGRDRVRFDDDPNVVPTASATPQPAPTGAFLVVDLSLTSAVGARSVRIEARINGRIPQYVRGSTGEVVRSSEGHVKYTRIDWGDSSLQDGSDGGDITCSPNTPLVSVDERFTEPPHRYANPGRYTITFETYACPPVGKVIRKLDIVVK